MKTAINNLKKSALAVFLFVICSVTARAQDKITLMTGEEINAKVVEITGDAVKFVSSDNSDGPVRVISKSEVFSISYPNGVKDIFGSHQKQADPGTQTRAAVVKPNPQATAVDTSEFLTAPSKKFGGPRFGLTYISPGTISDYITDKGKNPFITQFGWQFETRIFTIDNGPSGLVEFVPLIGGMEQGMFLPSANLLIGLRSGGIKAFEFALGPSLSLSGLGMVFAAGTNFRSGKVNFPVNLAVVPSVGTKKDVHDPGTGEISSKFEHTGWRVTLTVGFNSRKK